MGCAVCSRARAITVDVAFVSEVTSKGTDPTVTRVVSVRVLLPALDTAEPPDARSTCTFDYHDLVTV
jgi:hypothetical protein